MNCPLCNTKENLISKRTSLLEVKARWLSTFGFDPFPAAFSGAHIDKKRCAACHLEYFDPPFYGDADFYARISKGPWYYEQHKWEFDVAAEIVADKRPPQILEIGCGNGFFLEKIASLGLGVEGVDINRDAVSVCQAKGLKVDALNVFEITKSYDMVVLFQVLEHLENAKALFEFIVSKLLNPGGYLILAVPNPDGYLKEMGINMLDMPPHHNSCWGRATFEYLQTLFNLELVEYRKEPIRYLHYLGLIQEFGREHARLSPPSLSNKVLFKLQSLIVRLSAPLTYLRDRECIDGQTHLVVLKNVR